MNDISFMCITTSISAVCNRQFTPFNNYKLRVRVRVRVRVIISLEVIKFVQKIIINKNIITLKNNCKIQNNVIEFSIILIIIIIKFLNYLYCYIFELLLLVF